MFCQPRLPSSGFVVRPVSKELSIVCTPKLECGELSRHVSEGSQSSGSAFRPDLSPPKRTWWVAAGRRLGAAACRGLEFVGLKTSTSLSAAPPLWLADWFSEALTRCHGPTFPSNRLQITESPAEGAFTGLMGHRTGECWSVRSPPGRRWIAMLRATVAIEPHFQCGLSMPFSAPGRSPFTLPPDGPCLAVICLIWQLFFLCGQFLRSPYSDSDP